MLAHATTAHGPDRKEVPVAQVQDAYLAGTNASARWVCESCDREKGLRSGKFDPSADLLAAIDGLTLLAIVGIVDPPRPAAKDAIAQAHAAGIQVRMITGDHAVTAEAIAHQLGIKGRAITGADFRAMSDEEAMRQIDGIGVIARVSPEDKVHLVDILRKKGRVVGMTGDGVNDAPALKKADIGIAMGITGTEVSKQAAVMILTDDNYATIVKAIGLGRSVYDNLMRFIRFQMAGLFGISPRSSARPCSTSWAGSRSCRSRRCGSTSRSTCSRRSAWATAGRVRASWRSHRDRRSRRSCRRASRAGSCSAA